MIDNGANYKDSSKILMDWIPTLCWSPCAAHYLNLMLEQIGNFKTSKKPIAHARCVTTLIYRHGRLISAMRAYIGGKNSLRQQRLDLPHHLEH